MTYSTEVSHTQTSGSNRDFSVTFPFLAVTDIKVQLNGVTKTVTNDYTIVQAGANTVVNFNTAPNTNDIIRIFRDTDIDAIEATYAAGSSIRAKDLNDNNTQLLYAAQEFGTLKEDTSVSFTLGSKGDVTVNSSTDWSLNTNSVELDNMADVSVGTAELVNSSVTNPKVADNAIQTSYIQDNAIINSKMADNSVGTADIIDSNVTTAKIADNAVTMAKLNSGTLPSDIVVNDDNIAANSVNTSELVNAAVTRAILETDLQYAFNPIGTVIWFAGSSAPTGYLKANGDAITNGSGTTQNISADFSALYAIVGANLPDLRGEFIRGWADDRSVDSGRAIRSTQSDEFKNHQHLFGGDDNLGAAGGYTNVGSSYAYDMVSSSNGNSRHYRTKDNNTNYGGNETRPRNVALLACIKY